MLSGFALFISLLCVFLLGLLAGCFLAKRNAVSRDEHERICNDQKANYAASLELIKNMQCNALNQAQKNASELLASAQAKFAELSEAVLKRRSEELGDNNSRHVANVMKPYEARLDELKKELQHLCISNSRFQGSIEGFTKASECLSRQTETLSCALNGGQKSQGLFGEHQLEKILAASGLAEHAEYRLQCALPGGDQDARLIPDAVIQLPSSDALLVVDSKASFTAFMDYVNAGREENGESALKKHIDSLGKHIRELHGKHYAEEYRKRTGRDAVDTVFMFVPSDHALQAALTKKPELWQEAVTNGVLLVSPSTLMVAVHIVDIGWRRVEFNRNTDAILLKAQHLLDAIKEFLSSFDDVGQSLEAARGSWEKARHKLMPTVSGRGATISDSARQMTKLGVKSTPSPKHKAAEKYLYAVEAEDGEQSDSMFPNP